MITTSYKRIVNRILANFTGARLLGAETMTQKFWFYVFCVAENTPVQIGNPAHFISIYPELKERLEMAVNYKSPDIVVRPISVESFGFKTNLHHLFGSKETWGRSIKFAKLDHIGMLLLVHPLSHVGLPVKLGTSCPERRMHDHWEISSYSGQVVRHSSEKFQFRWTGVRKNEGTDAEKKAPSPSRMVFIHKDWAQDYVVRQHRLIPGTEKYERVSGKVRFWHYVSVEDQLVPVRSDVGQSIANSLDQNMKQSDPDLNDQQRMRKLNDKRSEKIEMISRRVNTENQSGVSRPWILRHIGRYFRICLSHLNYDFTTSYLVNEVEEYGKLMYKNSLSHPGATASFALVKRWGQPVNQVFINEEKIEIIPGVKLTLNELKEASNRYTESRKKGVDLFSDLYNTPMFKKAQTHSREHTYLGDNLLDEIKIERGDLKVPISNPLNVIDYPQEKMAEYSLYAQTFFPVWGKEESRMDHSFNKAKPMLAKKVVLSDSISVCKASQTPYKQSIDYLGELILGGEQPFSVVLNPKQETSIETIARIGLRYPESRPVTPLEYTTRDYPFADTHKKLMEIRRGRLDASCAGVDEFIHYVNNTQSVMEQANNHWNKGDSLIQGNDGICDFRSRLSPDTLRGMEGVGEDHRNILRGHIVVQRFIKNITFNPTSQEDLVENYLLPSFRAHVLARQHGGNVMTLTPWLPKEHPRHLQTFWINKPIHVPSMKVIDLRSLVKSIQKKPGIDIWGKAHGVYLAKIDKILRKSGYYELIMENAKDPMWILKE